MRRKILVALEDILRDPPKNSDSGICYRVYLHSAMERQDGINSELANIFKGWDQHSGNPIFPIKSSNRKKDAGQYYLSGVNLWRGEQLRYRISLMKYAIKKLKEEMDEVLPE